MKYKFSLLLIIANFLLFSTLLAQNKEASIKEIRQVVQNINNNKNLKKIVLRNDEFLKDAVPDGGGELTGYFKNGELVKINESIGFSNGISNTEFYLKNNKLIFAYALGKHFSINQKTLSINYNKLNTIFKRRYYFDNDELLHAINEGLMGSDSWENGASPEEIIKDVDAYIISIKNKKQLEDIKDPLYQKK